MSIPFSKCFPLVSLANVYSLRNDLFSSSSIINTLLLLLICSCMCLCGKCQSKQHRQQLHTSHSTGNSYTLPTAQATIHTSHSTGNSYTLPTAQATVTHFPQPRQQLHTSHSTGNDTHFPQHRQRYTLPIAQATVTHFPQHRQRYTLPTAQRTQVAKLSAVLSLANFEIHHSDKCWQLVSFQCHV